MRKIINNDTDVVAEMLQGILAAYPGHYEQAGSPNALVARARRKDGVSVVIGGGSGHEPTFSGFVGRGLADAAACGNVFASPNPRIICDAGRAVDTGKGVLFLYNNYAGDNMNFDIAEEMLGDEGIVTAHFRVRDDCVSAPRERMEDRRGIAGFSFVLKIVGAACDAGLSLDEVVRVAYKAGSALASIGVATSPATIPGSAAPFALGENEIEFGMGIHGEPGIRRTRMLPADELTDTLYAELRKEMDLRQGETVCALVNGLGSTTQMELFIVYRRLATLLAGEGISVHHADVGSYCTCQEMGGFSISLLRLDDELQRYYDAPAHSPCYFKGGN